MRPLRLLLVAMFALGSAGFIALVIPGVVFLVRNCAGSDGLHNTPCRQGVILASVATGMLLVALAAALALIWVKEPPAAQVKAGLQGKGAQVTPLDLRSDAIGKLGPTQDVEAAMQTKLPYQLYGNPMALYAPAFQDYPGAASRLEWHLAASQQLLWSLLHPSPPVGPNPPAPPLDPHPIPGQPYFDWNTMGSVLPGIQGGRYLPGQHQGMGAINLMNQGGEAAPGLAADSAPAPFQAPVPDWEFQAPRRGTMAYLARLEAMQGPNWRPVSTAGAQDLSTLASRQDRDIHLHVQSEDGIAGKMPRQMDCPQGAARMAEVAPEGEQAVAVPHPGIQASAAAATDVAQSGSCRQVSVEAEAYGQSAATEN